MTNYAKNHTKAEKKMWWLYLLGYYMPRRPKFGARRDSGWNLDWYSPIWRIAIEVSGSWHDQTWVKAKDDVKRKALRAKGIYVLEVSNKAAERSSLLLGIQIVLAGLLWWIWLTLRFSVFLIKQAFFFL